MSYTSSLDTIILPSTAIVTFNTGGVDLSPFLRGSLQLVWNYTTGNAAGTVTIQTSDDNVNFTAYPGASIAFNSSSLNDIFEFTSIGFKYVRLSFIVSSGSGGLVTVNGHFLRI